MVMLNAQVLNMQRPLVYLHVFRLLQGLEVYSMVIAEVVILLFSCIIFIIIVVATIK